MAKAITHDTHVRVARRFIRRVRIGKFDVWMWQNDQWILNLYWLKDLLLDNGFEVIVTDAQFGPIIGDFAMNYPDHGDPKPFECLSDPHFFGSEEGKAYQPEAYTVMEYMTLFCVVHTIKSLIAPPKRRGKNS